MGRDNDLTSEVKQLALVKGAHLVGIASVDRFEGAPRGHGPSDLLPGARSVIAIAQRFFQTIINSDTFCTETELIPKDELWQAQRNIFGFLYATVNLEMQMIGVQIAHLLSEKGYPTLPIPSSGAAAAHTPEFGSAHYTFFSNRHAAVLAGLGEFGFNKLLLTPKYGPRVRLDSIITTAELEPDPMVGNICLGEKCMLCIQDKACFGELHEFKMGGRTMRMARMKGCKKNLCGRSNPDAPLPYNRACIGPCPVGMKEGEHLTPRKEFIDQVRMLRKEGKVRDVPSTAS